jgi:hypothetical protein
MPNLTQIKQFIVTAIVPVIAGGLATWLSSTQVLAIFHITQNSAAAAISAVLVFGITALVTYLGAHHILSGHYSPGPAPTPVPPARPSPAKVVKRTRVTSVTAKK